jgi:hypothetical protein
MPVNFEVSREDLELIDAIVARVVEIPELLGEATSMQVRMDIVAVHANGCPLRLRELLKAPLFHFAHDIAGISRFLDRETGKIPDDRFTPRFAAQLVTAETIRVLLETTNRQHAMPMFDAMVAHASQDAEYNEHFTKWLAGADGGTLILRDKLCRIFENAEFLREGENARRRYPWDDCWMGIDSVHLEAMVRAGRKPPYFGEAQ